MAGTLPGAEAQIHSIVLVVELSLPDEASAKLGPRPSALIAIVLVLDALA